MHKALIAAPGVSARYAKAHGSQLVIEINVGSPPPASVILVQHFPAGVLMLDSQPSASNYNPKSKKAKWLLRNLRPGTTRVSVTLDQNVERDDISAEIRFKPQQGGSMATIQVQK